MSVYVYVYVNSSAGLVLVLLLLLLLLTRLEGELFCGVYGYRCGAYHITRWGQLLYCKVFASITGRWALEISD